MQPPVELSPFEQELVAGEDNAYGMSFKDLANDYADVWGGLAEATTPYGDVVALNDWRKGELDTLGKVLTAASLLPGFPNVRNLKVRTFRKDKPFKTIEALVNPTAEDLKKAARNLDPDTPKHFRMVFDRETGDTYAWPALDAIHADVVRQLGLEAGIIKPNDVFSSNPMLGEQLYPEAAERLAKRFSTTDSYDPNWEKNIQKWKSEAKPSPKFNLEEGLGNVPILKDNKEQMVVNMTPSEFLGKAARIKESDFREESIRRIKEALGAEGKGIAPPYLRVGHNKELGKDVITGHEGRHRMQVIRSMFGDIPVPVHVIPEYPYNKQWLSERNVSGFMSESDARFREAMQQAEKFLQQADTLLKTKK